MVLVVVVVVVVVVVDFSLDSVGKSVRTHKFRFSTRVARNDSDGVNDVISETGSPSFSFSILHHRIHHHLGLLCCCCSGFLFSFRVLPFLRLLMTWELPRKGRTSISSTKTRHNRVLSSFSSTKCRCQTETRSVPRRPLPGHSFESATFRFAVKLDGTTLQFQRAPR